eukprot:CAMPEP_0119353788 /NCGR_PEP_ID=MMETSP1334-20130426/2885_1 /TAXON_ID=127549 /ORGANISM="Calcidiscus leptoporus, Strain RCC1130" /LENGTH=202 /DNA_ID=CAMNT_0007367159 /DNA_START=9 /DNA_END=613 /DNA_ORIENTATION=-
MQNESTLDNSGPLINFGAITMQDESTLDNSAIVANYGDFFARHYDQMTGTEPVPTFGNAVIYPPSLPPPPSPQMSPPPLSPGEILIYTISWNATFQTTVEAFPTDAYIANVSAALGVPASSVSVSVSAGSVVVTTRVSAGHNATEAARLTNIVPTLCITEPLTMGDSCTPPVVDVETMFGPASVTGDPHFYGADGDRIDFKG